MNIEDLLTAADIARAAQVHRSTVSHWITGKLKPVLERAVEGKKRAERFFSKEAAQPLIAEALAKKPLATSDIA